MGRIIILEGPDGGGKTTVAKKLEANGWHYRHDGVPPPGRDNITYYFRQIMMVAQLPFDVVWDRFWLGERIYGTIARGVDTIDVEGNTFFLQLHRIMNVTMKICLPNIKTARANYLEKMKDSTDYLQSMSRWEQVYKAYAGWAFVYKIAIYDYEKDGESWQNW